MLWILINIDKQKKTRYIKHSIYYTAALLLHAVFAVTEVSFRLAIAYPFIDLLDYCVIQKGKSLNVFFFSMTSPRSISAHLG